MKFESIKRCDSSLCLISSVGVNLSPKSLSRKNRGIVQNKGMNSKLILKTSSGCISLKNFSIIFPEFVLDSFCSIVVIGLDCMTPQLVFDRWKSELPTFSRIMDEGVFGRIGSITPPITVPAWASMMTGFLPGRLGFYGFRNRRDYSYDKLFYVSSRSLKEKTVWDVLGENGLRSIVVAFPPSYPPKPIHGYSISCFLTPGPESDYTYPPELKEEIEARFGPFMFDVKGFRTEDKDYLRDQIFKMTEQRFKVARYLLKEKEWDLVM
jgi:predicted AlkP superfamily phosphohydrolase/phosphomutase